MSKKISLLLARGGVAVAAVSASASSFAAGLDVTAATTAITASETPIQDVGMAVFAVLVLVATVKWLRRVL